jgi:hypothetical protein
MVTFRLDRSRPAIVCTRVSDHVLVKATSWQPWSYLPETLPVAGQWGRKSRGRFVVRMSKELGVS